MKEYPWAEDLWDLEAWVNYYNNMDKSDPRYLEFRDVIWHKIRSMTWVREYSDIYWECNVEDYFDWDEATCIDTDTWEEITLVEQYRKVLKNDFADLLSRLRPWNDRWNLS